jgi:hypothetical protein
VELILLQYLCVEYIGVGSLFRCPWWTRTSILTRLIPKDASVQSKGLNTKVPYVTPPQLMSHRHASTVFRQVLVLQKKECVPAGRRTTEFLYQAYRTVGSDACSDGYSRCVQYGRFEYQF